MNAEKKFRVWRAPLSGRYFAGWASPRVMPSGVEVWEFTGRKYDVTEDIERIITEAAGGTAPTDPPIDPQRLWLGPDRCHSNNDGDCEWTDCPQKADYQTWCPLARKYEDE